MFHNEIDIANASYRMNLDDIFDAYLITDPKGTIIFFSDSVLKLFNVVPEQIGNKHISVLFPDEEILSKESFRNMEYVLDIGSRKVSLFRTRSILEDNEGNITQVIEGLLDTTNSKKMYELKANMESEKSKHEHDRSDFINWKEMYASKDQRMLDNIIYALNNSLNSMGGPMLLDYVKQHMEKKQDGYSIDKDGYEAFEELVKTLYPLLNNIAKLEQLLQKEAELSEVSLDEFVQFVKHCVANSALNCEIQNNKIQLIHVPSDHGKAKLKINKKYLEEIVSELLTNAFKYSKPDENIWIDIETSNNIAKCKISNIPIEYRKFDREFIGVPYEYTEQVFNPFERLNWNISNKFTESWGFGLGLFAVRKMMEKMNGKVECYNGIFYKLHHKSKPITTFCINLPFEGSNHAGESIRRTK